jgi:hypothetical protein
VVAGLEIESRERLSVRCRRLGGHDVTDESPEQAAWATGLPRNEVRSPHDAFTGADRAARCRHRVCR